jgi:hypothetical protein
MIAATLAFVLLVIGYGPNGGSSAEDPSDTAAERWQSIVDRGGGSGVWTLTKDSDGTVTVAGEWTYQNSIKCPFTGGKATLSGSSFLFTVKGTATNSSAPSGYQDSPFTLEVKGELKDGKGRGTFAISFSAEQWPPGFSGKWNATRTEGKGVTG